MLSLKDQAEAIYFFRTKENIIQVFRVTDSTETMRLLRYLFRYKQNKYYVFAVHHSFRGQVEQNLY